MNMTFCEKNKSEELEAIFVKHLKDFDVKNVFNPSFYMNDEVEVFSFRAIQSHKEINEKNIEAFLSIKSKKNNLTKNLSNDLRRPRRVEDPKVVELNGEIFITFNSGLHNKKPHRANDIYIMKVFPQLGKQKRIIYEQRQRREKNWAFFYENGNVYSLYSINPLTILKVSKRERNTWTLEKLYEQEQKNKDVLTIGTPMFKHKDSYYLSYHNKIEKHGKKIYTGGILTFSFKDKSIIYDNHSLTHSFESLFGADTKLNKNLYSCTYFSGLSIGDNILSLSYGINDIDYGFAEFELNENGGIIVT
jgi:predicted GH43/DUF377 family glycosyl hydrolase